MPCSMWRWDPQPLGGLTNNNVYYVRKTTGTTKIALYDSRVNASNTSSTSGLTTLTGTGNDASEASASDSRRR